MALYHFTNDVLIKIEIIKSSQDRVNDVFNQDLFEDFILFFSI